MTGYRGTFLTLIFLLIIATSRVEAHGESNVLGDEAKIQIGVFWNQVTKVDRLEYIYWRVTPVSGTIKDAYFIFRLDPDTELYSIAAGSEWDCKQYTGQQIKFVCYAEQITVEDTLGVYFYVRGSARESAGLVKSRFGWFGGWPYEWKMPTTVAGNETIPSALPQEAEPVLDLLYFPSVTR